MLLKQKIEDRLAETIGDPFKERSDYDQGKVSAYKQVLTWIKDEELEKEKTPEIFMSEAELEAANKELDFAHNQDMKIEEGITHEENL